MKQLCLIIVGIIVLGCSNQKDSEIKRNFQEDTFEVSIKAFGNIEHRYQLMENFPAEGGPLITKEPHNSVVSEINYGEGGIYYHYGPEAGFTGTDEVVITNNISNGA